MAQKSSFACYRNWVAEVGEFLTAESSLFEAAAPGANLLTEQPGQLAIAAIDSPASIAVNIGGSGSVLVGRPVGVVALINTNALLSDSTAAAFRCRLTDSSGATGVWNSAALSLSTDGTTYNNVFWVTTQETAESFACDLTDIVKIEILMTGAMTYGRRNLWTNEVTNERMFVGTLLAGPVYRPAYGIRMVGFAPGSVDSSRTVRAIGGALWTSPQTRLRQLQGELTLVPESEIEALPPSCGLRQMADWCGVSRPVLIVPSDSNETRLHQQSFYGHFSENLSWPLVSNVYDPVVNAITPHHTCAFSIIEAR